MRIEEKGGKNDHVYCSSRGEVLVNCYLTLHVRTGYPPSSYCQGWKSLPTRRDWSPPCMCTRKVLHGTKVNRGGGGASQHQNQVFSVAARLFCYQGAWNSLAIGSEENSEIVCSTYLSPSLKFAYVSSSLHFFLSALLYLLNITAGLGGIISAALTGRPKPTQKWTFNELDSEPVVTHSQHGPSL